MSLLEQVQADVRRAPPVIRLPLIVPTFALPLYWGFTYSGPYRWLAEWQLQNFHSYRPRLTGGLIFIVLALPVLALLRWLGRRAVAKSG